MGFLEEDLADADGHAAYEAHVVKRRHGGAVYVNEQFEVTSR